MDEKENKIIELYKTIRKQDNTKSNNEYYHVSKLQTNPIIQRMLLCTLNKKKQGFKFKDLFK